MISNDRYLNVQYDSLTAEVNITGISRLGGVKRAIKAELSNALAQVDAPQLQLYTDSNKDQLINTWALFMSLSQEYFTEGGAFVVIGFTSPRPPLNNQPAFPSGSPLLLFKEGLKNSGINTSFPAVEKVVEKVWRSYSWRMIAIAGDATACRSLYEEIKSLPATFTRGIIQRQLNISLNGPISGQTLILSACHNVTGVAFIIKLLRPPQLMQSADQDMIKDAVDNEVEASEAVTSARIPGLVMTEAVQVQVTDSTGIDVSEGVWTALKMPYYHFSLINAPALSQHLLQRGFHRLRTALQRMHELQLVHMDVKSDNVFIDGNTGDWFLGDFGSTRKINSPCWTFTEALHPYKLVRFVSNSIPAMDFVSLCVMIAVQMEKTTWKDALCGDEQTVQEGLIVSRLKTLENVDFRNDIVKTFEENFRLVVDHLERTMMS